VQITVGKCSISRALIHQLAIVVHMFEKLLHYYKIQW